VVTLVFHVPKFNRFIDDYINSSYHVAAAFPFLPAPTYAAGIGLMVLHHAAAWALLLGWAPRLCAWFLAAAGFYVMSLDPDHYAHNAQFHLTLLALVGCAGDRLTLRRLLAEDGADAKCPAWPERLIQIQLGIVFFYAAFDKILSPHWGVTGSVLAAQRLAPHAGPFAWLQRLNGVVIKTIPGILSVATVVTEFLLALGFLVRPRGVLLIAGAVGFVAYLEFMLRPGAFAWDVLAALLVCTPAADRGWTATYDPQCLRCRRNRRVGGRLDWLRRIRWMAIGEPVRPSVAPAPAANQSGAGIQLTSPSGRTYRGPEILRVLPLVFPGPLLLTLVVVRFAGGFLANRGYGRWDDMPFIILAGLLALWTPGASRLVGAAHDATRALWLHATGRQSGGDTVETCSLHARKPRVLDPPAPAR
jgi:hypothetical protein